jgi:hypothetical protein
VTIELDATTARAVAVIANQRAPGALDMVLDGRASVIAAYKRARGNPKLRDARIWIQLREGVTVDRFLDVVDALLGAGVTWLDVSHEPPIAKPPEIPKLQVGPIQSTDSWPAHRGAVRRALERQTDKLVYCYEKQRLVSPTLDGSLSLSIDLDDIGDVLAVKAAGIDPEVASCVTAIVKAMKFPRPRPGAKPTITTSLTFRPGA